MARPGSRLKAMASPAPVSGITTNCAATPKATSPGCRATAEKSATVSVSPIPSMMTPRPHSIHGWNHFHASG